MEYTSPVVYNHPTILYQSADLFRPIIWPIRTKNLVDDWRNIPLQLCTTIQPFYTNLLICSDPMIIFLNSLMEPVNKMLFIMELKFTLRGAAILNFVVHKSVPYLRNLTLYLTNLTFDWVFLLSYLMGKLILSTLFLLVTTITFLNKSFKHDSIAKFPNLQGCTRTWYPLDLR